MGISISVNAKNLQNFLKRAELSLGERQKFLTDIADLELSSTRARFIRQVDPQGKPWKKTLRQKRNSTAKILRRTGVLFNSLARKIVGDTAFIGTNISYAKIHQEGGRFSVPAQSRISSKGKPFTIPSFVVNMPKRQIIGTNSQTILNIDTVINKLINKDVL